MPSINFQAQFRDAVKSGAKRQTIRSISTAARPVQYRVGDTAYLYSGLRGNSSQKLGEGRITHVSQLSIFEDSLHFAEITRRFLGLPEDVACDAFARLDGFKDWSAMTEWFQQTHELPFSGQIICWDLIPQSEWTGKPA